MPVPARRGAPPRAIPLLVTVFGDAVLPFGGRVWLGSLIRLLAPLGVSERLARTAVFRLSREHWLRAEALGRRSDYLLTDFGRRQFEAAERHIYASAHGSWDGRWRMLAMLPAKWSAAEREHLRRSLAWQGFGQLDGNVFLHPSAPLEQTLAALDTEDYPRLREKIFALTGDGPGEPHAIVRAAWDLAELSRAYGAFVRRYRPLAPEAAARLAPESAFVTRTLLIHEYRRLLLRDPGLPGELALRAAVSGAGRALAGALAGRVAHRGRHATRAFARLCASLQRPLARSVRLGLRRLDSEGGSIG
jgi:phenylacetic acid degradation operon negative regulatory protein